MVLTQCVIYPLPIANHFVRTAIKFFVRHCLGLEYIGELKQILIYRKLGIFEYSQDQFPSNIVPQSDYWRGLLYAIEIFRYLDQNPTVKSQLTFMSERKVVAAHRRSEPEQHSVPSKHMIGEKGSEKVMRVRLVLVMSHQQQSYTGFASATTAISEYSAHCQKSESSNL